MAITSSGRRASRVVLALLLALVAALLSGCLRYTQSLTIAADDTVSGIIIIGARKQGSSGDAWMPTPQPGQELPAPTSTTSRIVVAPFDHDQESGYKITFRGATFDEVSQFAPLGEKGGRLELSRDGNDILVSMTIDLTYAVPADQIDYFKQNAKATVQLIVPGTVVSTDGQVDGQKISWDLEPLELNTLHARVESQPGTQATETSRSIDPVRAGIIGAILLGLLLLGWFLGRDRLRMLLAPGGSAGRAPSWAGQRGRIDEGRPAKSVASSRETPPLPIPRADAAPDPFGETPPARTTPAPPRTTPAPVVSRVPERVGGPRAGHPIPGGGWPPPRPRWKEER